MHFMRDSIHGGGGKLIYTFDWTPILNKLFMTCREQTFRDSYFTCTEDNNALYVIKH